MENQRMVATMGLEYDDDALCDFSKAFITSKQTELEIKYPNLQPILSLHDKTAAGDCSHLDAYFPDPNKKKVWVASDSVLELYNSESPKGRRTFDEQWQENSRVWKPFITKAVFLVRSSGEILDALKMFKQKLLNDPVARGDPRLLA